MKTIKLSDEKHEIVVDDEDYKLLNIFCWSKWGGGKGRIPYARTHISQTHLKVFDLIEYTHNFEYREPVTPPDILLGKQKFPYVIDHRDRNPLNNRKSNLRICTVQQNCFNKSTYKNKKDFRGVVRNGDKFLTVIQGYAISKHKTAIKAAIAYDKEALKRYGEFAVLNFPEGEL